MAEIPAAMAAGLRSHRSTTTTTTFPLILQGCGRTTRVLGWKPNTEKHMKLSMASSYSSPSSTGPVTFTSTISTDIPLYEPPGQASFDDYIQDKPRVFNAMFPDKRRGKRLNDEEWQIQMLPIQFLFASVTPVVVMRLKCKSLGKEYPSVVPLHAPRVLELQATRWELRGLESMYMPSHFSLRVQGALYAERRRSNGGHSRLKGHLEMSISLVLPSVLALVPENILRVAAETVLKRLVEKMKQEVDGGLLSDFQSFRKEMLMTTKKAQAITSAAADRDTSSNQL